MLIPPAPPPEHPADLVIDVFGAFLGRRSERLVVRWRSSGDASDQRPSAGGVSAPGVVRFAAPSAGTPQPHREAPASDEAPVPDESPAERRAHNAAVEATGSDRDQTPKTTNADRAAERLLALWKEESPEPAPPRPSAAARLRDELDRISEKPAAPARSADWDERLVPLSRLRSVTVSGRGVTISSDLIESLIERGIALSFLSGRGQPIAMLSAPGLGGTVQTRRSQLEAYTSPLGVKLAVSFVSGKLRNQKHQLQYSGKYLKATDPARFERLEKKIAAIANIRRQLVDFSGTELEHVRDQLMGFEGTAARIYWEGVAIVLEGRIEFPGRQTRGAVDPVNSALNYAYGILYSRVSAAILNAGLEMFAGFLHVDRPGKPSLVLDLVEEFRAPVADRTVLALINQGTPLETDEHGLTVSTRRVLADRVIERLATPVPYEGKRWPLSNVIQSQARHLAVAVRGERLYQPFASRW